MQRNIEVRGKRYSLEWISDRENPVAQRILADQLHKKTVFCHCTGKPLPLFVSHRHNMNYHLSKVEHTGSSHSPACVFFETSNGQNAQGESKPARIVRSDGTIDIKLDCQLRQTSTGSAAPRRDSKGTEAGTSRSKRSSWTLLGLLLDAWETGELNKWFPRRPYSPTLNSIRKSLIPVLEPVVVSGQRLRDILFIPEYVSNWSESERVNLNRLRAITTTPGQFALVISTLERLVVSSKSSAKALSLSRVKPNLWMEPDLVQDVEQSFARQLAGVGDKSQKVVVIATVRRENENYKVGAVSMMTVSPEFIPADSSHELRVIARLVEEKRFFIKPLRLEEKDLLPDFRLLDSQPCAVMEVFGMMNDPVYRQHAADKVRAYAKWGVPLWQWDPSQQTDMPDFPPRRDFGTATDESH